MKQRTYALLVAATLITVMLWIAPDTESSTAPPHNIVGYVFDQNGNPMGGVHLTVTEEYFGHIVETYSEPNGYYQVPLSKYNVSNPVTVKGLYKSVEATNYSQISSTHSFTVIELTMPLDVYSLFGSLETPGKAVGADMEISVFHDGKTQTGVSNSNGMYWFDMGSNFSPFETIEISVWGNGFSKETAVNPVALPYEFNIILDDIEPPTVTASSASSVPLREYLNVQVQAHDNDQVISGSLYYKMEGESSFTAITLVKSGNYWNCDIPGMTNTGRLLYYVSMYDGTNYGRFPASGNVIVDVIDVLPPEIFHTPVTTVASHEDLALTCHVTDDHQVETVVLHYMDLTGNTYQSQMTPSSSDTYTAAIPAQKKVGVMYYRIEAGDGFNVFSSPVDGNYTVTVADVLPPVVTPIIPATAHAHEGVMVKADITDNIGVASGYLFYKIPGATDFVNTSMTPSGKEYSFHIPPFNSTGTLSLYIIAQDTSGNVKSEPSDAPAFLINVSVVDALSP
ncbi:MAG TPA: carboxypeptidase regulatory-like domain-containing protein, partial [Euryarchaeota archaeon]|nr:carboxypeptidase regulatory-like domain-containing protein [Euryarchaeota archaeon]